MRNEKKLIKAVNQEADKADKIRPLEKSLRPLVTDLGERFPGFGKSEIEELVIDAWQTRNLFWRE